MSAQLKNMFDWYARHRAADLVPPAPLFVRAIETGNLLDVMLVLHAFPDAVHWQDDMRRTALHLAIRADQVEVANLLLHAGADVHARDRTGMTAEMLLFARGWTYVSAGSTSSSANSAHTATGKGYSSAGARAYADAATRNNEHTRQNRVSTAPPQDMVGESFRVSPKGALLSNTGHIAIFSTQKDAAQWILSVGNVKAKAQVFEVGNHPDIAGRFCVIDRAAAARAAAAGAPHPR